MKCPWNRLKEQLALSWQKGFIIIAYFLLFGVLNTLITLDWPFIIFAWPFYFLPRQGLLAATIEFLYVYALATLTIFLLECHGKKKE